MNIKEKIKKLEQHLQSNPCDFGGQLLLFDLIDQAMLEQAKKAYPHSIIRMPNADLVARGVVSGIGGSVPAEWDGSIVSFPEPLGHEFELVLFENLWDLYQS